MKCPKCGYLGFEPVDRCRNCGYDFSLSPLSSAVSTLELSLKSEPVRMPLVEDMQIDRASANAPSAGATLLDRELPLFGGHLSDDLPLITKPSPPRPPLAVRRATPEVPRVRVAPARTPTLDLSGDVQMPAPMRNLAPAVPRAPDGERSARPVSDVAADASVMARLLAVAIDVAVLGMIDAVVVYFTLQICGMGLADFALLPRVPLLAFFLVQNGGYLVVFTAGGQTLGKMAAGIKVVSAESRSPVDLSSACVRELLWLVLAAPAGLGLLTVFAGDHRGIHDRFAGTRVVRASL